MSAVAIGVRRPFRGGGGNTIYFQDLPPSNPNLNDLWYQTSQGNWPRRWDGTIWADARDLLVYTVQSDLANLNTNFTAAITNANGRYAVTFDNGTSSITGIELIGGTGQQSVFRVRADRFEVTNGTTNAAPFTVVGSQVRINGTLFVGGTGTSLEQLASNSSASPLVYVGAFASAPSPGSYVANNVYRNTTDGNTYVLQSGAWVLFLEKGAGGSAGGAGAAGPPGTRGSRQFYASNTAWSDAIADAAIVAFGLTKVVLDSVTISGGTFSQTRYWDGGGWVPVTAVIDGNLLVNGSVGATKIDTRGLDIKAADGTVILSATQNLDFSRVLPSPGWLNSAISLGANGALNGAGGGQVTIAGLDNTVVRQANPITAVNISTYIGAAAIGDAYINNLNANKINAGFLSVARIENNSLTAEKIDTRNLTIRDGAGNVIFGAGTNLDFTRVNANPGWLNSSITIGSNGQLNGGGGGQVTLGGLGFTGATDATRNTFTVSASAPASPVNGDLWFDTVQQAFFVRNAGAWVRTSDVTASNTAAAIAGQGAFATLNQINASNVSTYIASAAIGDAYIADLNAAKITVGQLNAARINLDGLTLTNSGGALAISNGGVSTTQLAANAVTKLGFNFSGSSVLPNNFHFSGTPVLALAFSKDSASSVVAVNYGASVAAEFGSEPIVIALTVDRGSGQAAVSSAFCGSPGSGSAVWIDQFAGTGLVTYRVFAYPLNNTSELTLVYGSHLTAQEFKR